MPEAIRNRLAETRSADPYQNLAFEELLFLDEFPGATLYLWQNERTVVIGRYQNAWKECRAQLLADEGGRLARRSSGGGAVFHDLGNLNFTFLVPRERYDLEKQLAVIQSAAASFGIAAERSGRNDLVLAGTGAKFSGNAFRFTKTRALHHGTLLISVDRERMARYLAPSPEKLRAKGIESVRSRVTNLAEQNPAVTVDSMAAALKTAFGNAYGAYDAVDEALYPPDALSEAAARYASWDWRFGQTPPFDIELSHRFSYGELTLLLSLENAHVTACAVQSDALDTAFLDGIPVLLTGAAFSPAALSARFTSLGSPDGAETAAWLAGLTF